MKIYLYIFKTLQSCEAKNNLYCTLFKQKIYFERFQFYNTHIFDGHQFTLYESQLYCLL